MKNRNLSSPILFAVALSLAATPPLLSRAETEVSNSSEAVVSASTVSPGGPVVASGTTVVPKTSHTSTYTVVKGDTLTRIAEKFNSTRRKLEALNHLASSKVEPGQILQVPARKSAKTATAATSPATPRKTHHTTYLVAQPVQGFDVSTSSPGSHPARVSPPKDTDAPVTPEKRAPIAQLVSPAELTAASAPEHVAAAEPAPQIPDALVTPSASTKHFSNTVPTSSTSMSPAADSISPTAATPPASRPTYRDLSSNRRLNPLITPPANDWSRRFLEEARALGNQGIEYDEDWRPPGESQSWAMDCSNTARYIYKVTTGIQLPRTASDQYYYLHLQGKAWDVPQDAEGLADTSYLRRNLKPGDLLFWENTYRPERQPPITHVMIFLGTNDQGQWIMAGSQTSRGGEHNRRNGGPDIYVFRPSQPCGGYTTWLGLVHHKGRFCAFGRPLEADRSKLSVVANN